MFNFNIHKCSSVLTAAENECYYFIGMSLQHSSDSIQTLQAQNFNYVSVVDWSLTPLIFNSRNE